MADEIITKQELIDAKVDAASLELFISGTDTEEVLTRLGRTYPTLPKAIRELMETGGWKAYTTEVALLATVPTVNPSVAYAFDTKKMYLWNGTAWVNEGLSQLDQAINFANANGLFTPINVLSNSALLASDFKTKGWYIFPSAAPATAAGLPEPNAGYLFVINSGNMVHQKWIPFNSNNEYTRTSTTNATFPDFQKLITSAALDLILTNYIDIFNINQYTKKPYDIITVSKNLFYDENIILGKYLNNSGNIAAAVGWGCSEFIPIEAGKTYTISAQEKGRHGCAFFKSAFDTECIIGSYNNSSALPLTVIAPSDASFLVINVFSPMAQNYSKIQVELGSVATTYEKGETKYQIDASYLNTSIENTDNKLIIDGDNASVSGVVDDVSIFLSLLLTKENTHSNSTVFNFSGDYVNDILQRNLNDDVAPMRMDEYTVGANHGYQKNSVTVNGHGKTAADIGSVWNDSVREYVIVDIPSPNVIDITSRVGNFVFQMSRTLIHVSGAANTTSFTPTSLTQGQWYPAIRDRKLNCFVDDIKIDLNQDSTYPFKNTVKFLESYSIMKKSDIVEWLITNKGQNHVNYNAVPAYTVNFGYTFDHECGCTIYFGGVGRKTVDLIDQMITQSIQLAQGNGTVYNYIPKAVEFTAGGFTYNFSQLENLYSKNPSSALFLTAARQEVGANPIDRIVMLNDQVGYATGYLPVLDAAPDVRVTNASRKYLEIRNGSLKLYPRLIDSDSITQINEGDAFAAIAYRKYFKRSANRTCSYVVRSERGDYLYLDWHVAKTDEIDLPSDLVGREFEIVEKSSNVTLLSKFASNSILVKIDATKNYGYLVIKFK